MPTRQREIVHGQLRSMRRMRSTFLFRLWKTRHSRETFCPKMSTIFILRIKQDLMQRKRKNSDEQRMGENQPANRTPIAINNTMTQKKIFKSVWLPSEQLPFPMSHEKRAATNLSDFYLACRHGNLDFVQQYLSDKNNAHVEINRHEEGVNSTPLHAACYYGHKEIAHLLLARGCDRSQVNGYGLTAFEEARNDEIRQMFKRPTSKSTMRRFLDESVDDLFWSFRTLWRTIERGSITQSTEPSDCRNRHTENHRSKAFIRKLRSRRKSAMPPRRSACVNRNWDVSSPTRCTVILRCH